jgi:hypothetical protein
VNNWNRKLRGGQLQPDGSRQHRYSRELAQEICSRIATGETLTAICGDPGIPITPGAVRQWIIDNRDGFACGYTRARQAQAECGADELLAIADDDRLEPNDRRVRLDVRKWLMARLHPVGGDSAAPIAHIVGVVDLEQLSGAELDVLERFTNARLAAKEAQEHSN